MRLRPRSIAMFTLAALLAVLLAACGGSTGTTVPDALDVSNYTTTNVVVGTALDLAANVSGGLEPYDFALADGSALPTGMTLDATTGAITGTPTEIGLVEGIVVVTDDAAQAADLAYSINVTGVPGPDDDPEPYWEMVVTSGADEPFEVTGSSVAFASPNVIVLGDSTPAGWSVSFTVSGDVPIGFNGADNDDLLNATVGTPTGSDCVVTPASTYAGLTFVTLGLPDGDVPTGIGNVTVDGGCGTFGEVTGFVIGFGVE